MKITSVKPRKKSLKAIYIDEEHAFDIDSRTFLESEFDINSEITDEQLQKLISLSNANRAKNKALYLLSRKDYSKKELKDKLKRDTTEEAADKAVDRMEELDLIDEEDYARRYAKDLMFRKRYARRRAEYQMCTKGIAEDLIEEVLDEIEPEPVDQIVELLEGKFRNTLEDKKLKRRTYASLQRLGYSYEDIKEAVSYIERG